MDGKDWVPGMTDNDGLWTAIFGVGELMRYSVTKREGRGQAEIAEAQQSALRALKAVLMITNIPGRNGTVQAKIRHLLNTRTGEGAFY